MTGVIRKATLLAALGLVVAVSVATAGIPSPANCTFPTYIDLVGYNVSGVVDPRGAFTVTIRDIGNFPVVNQLVSVGFNALTVPAENFRIYNAFPGFISCQCAEATTDINGLASFAAIPGGGKNTGNRAAGLAFTGASAATFYAGSCGGIILGTAHVTAYDENGGATTKGVEIGDLSAWVSDYNYRCSPPTMYRSNFNHSVDGVCPSNSAVGIADLSSWVNVYNAQTSKYSFGTLCP